MRAQLAHEARRVPGGPAGEPPLLKQHHVAPAELSQVIGDRAADHPAANDDDACAVRKAGAGHLQARLNRDGLLFISTNYHKIPLYFAKMISQPCACHTEASAGSGILSTITPAHLSMFGTRNGVRRVNLVSSASR